MRTDHQRASRPAIQRSRAAAWLALGLAVSSGCSGPDTSSAPTPPQPASSDPTTPCATAVVGDPDELAALTSCVQLTGDLVIRGGALDRGDPLALQVVTGSVRIGPTLALVSLDFLPALTRIGGDLVLDSNLSGDGLYALALQRVDGHVIATGNTALGGWNTPRLESIGGDLVIARNPTLRRIDLSALRRVGGALRITDNAGLDDLYAPLLAEASAVDIARNPDLPDPLIESLRQQVAAPP